VWVLHTDFFSYQAVDHWNLRAKKVVVSRLCVHPVRPLPGSIPSVRLPILPDLTCWRAACLAIGCFKYEEAETELSEMLYAQQQMKSDSPMLAVERQRGDAALGSR
jgi:hypothetical protein